MELLLILCTSVLFIFGNAEKARFDNYQVYSLHVASNEQLELMYSIQNHPDGFLFWNNIDMGRDVDLMVPPHKLPDFLELTAKFGINYQLKVENVQRLIDNERPVRKTRAFDWTDYQTYTEIFDWLDQQLIAFPSVLTDITLGLTYEGRPIRMVKLSHKTNNPAIFIEANIHAREWITSATATWWLNELLTSTDPAIVDLAENIDWYIIPVYNVDGFHYSHTVNRLWRKTRQPHAHLCYGTDANRNFDFNWMVNNGASSNPCSETFAGPTPFSEPETVALANFIRQHSSEIKIYLSFHSYGQYILFPYGHTHDITPHHDVMDEIGQSTAEAFAARNGTDYVVGTTANALYVASGISVDWAYGVENIHVGYTLEFRDRRGGNYGFVLPADQILPNCWETRDALVEMVSKARQLNVLPLTTTN